MSDFYDIYILENVEDGNWYTGYTQDLQSRFEWQKAGKISSTRPHRPLKLIYFEGCIHKQDAVNGEKYLKTRYGKMFVKNRLKSYFTGQEDNNH